MTQDEYDAWLEKDADMRRWGGRAHSPCVDCPRWFAIEMRAENRCDGEPGRSFAVNGRDLYHAQQRLERTQRQVEARRLSAQGLRNADVARAMGASPQAVSRWLRDPVGERLVA